MRKPRRRNRESLKAYEERVRQWEWEKTRRPRGFFSLHVPTDARLVGGDGFIHGGDADIGISCDPPRPYDDKDTP